jgi:hypothetical protein
MIDDKNNICKKCNAKIGGKSYYILESDCLYDGENVSNCETIILCSDCYHKFDIWLNE